MICHNNHKDSPRTDAEVGDVMGAIVIRIPVHRRQLPAVGSDPVRAAVSWVGTGSRSVCGYGWLLGLEGSRGARWRQTRANPRLVACMASRGTTDVPS